MSLKQEVHARTSHSMDRVKARRTLRTFTRRVRHSSPSLSGVASLLLAVACSCGLAIGASAESTNWLVEQRSLEPFDTLGELGEVTVGRISFSLDERRSRNRIRAVDHGRQVRTAGKQEPCPRENYLAVMPDLRGIPRWALSELDDCSIEGESSLEGLIPRISIEGTFFRVGYSVEIDKDEGGLFMEYGAFTFGVGDSPSGAAIFNGLTFGLPAWTPGRRLLPRGIRDGLKFDAGVMLPIDTIDITEWKPQFGIGVRLLEW